MVQWHIETDFVAIAIFTALLVKAQFLNMRKNFTDQTFLVATLLGIGSAAVDIFSSTVMNNLTGWWPYEIGMILYGLFAPMLTILWVAYTSPCSIKATSGKPGASPGSSSLPMPLTVCCASRIPSIR